MVAGVFVLSDCFGEDFELKASGWLYRASLCVAVSGCDELG